MSVLSALKGMALLESLGSSIALGCSGVGFYPEGMHRRRTPGCGSGHVRASERSGSRADATAKEASTHSINRF